MTPDKKLAIVMHDNMCHSNHTDQCSWLYEIDGKGKHIFGTGAHDYYEQKARKVLNKLIKAFPDVNRNERLYEIAKTVFLSLK